MCVCVCDGGLAILSRLNEVSNNMPEARLETGHTHTHRGKEAGLKIVAVRLVNLHCSESWGRAELTSLADVGSR